MKIRMISMWVMILTALVSVQAEMRIWTSKKGDMIEAEFVNTMGKKVVLKKIDGKQIQVPVSGLCKNDQTYLAALIPPDIEIEVDVDKKTIKPYESSGYVRKQETISCEISITKKSKEACNRSFTATIFVFAEDIRGDYFKVILKSEHPFDFKKNKATQFSTDAAELTSREGYGLNKEGLKYDGYIIVVEDTSGEIIGMDMSKKNYEKNIEKIKKCIAGSWCTRDFKLTKHKGPTSSYYY